MTPAGLASQAEGTQPQPVAYRMWPGCGSCCGRGRQRRGQRAAAVVACVHLRLAHSHPTLAGLALPPVSCWSSSTAARCLHPWRPSRRCLAWATRPPGAGCFQLLSFVRAFVQPLKLKLVFIPLRAALSGVGRSTAVCDGRGSGGEVCLAGPVSMQRFRRHACLPLPPAWILFLCVRMPLPLANIAPTRLPAPCAAW